MRCTRTLIGEYWHEITDVDGPKFVTDLATFKIDDVSEYDRDRVVVGAGFREVNYREEHPNGSRCRCSQLIFDPAITADDVLLYGPAAQLVANAVRG